MVLKEEAHVPEQTPSFVGAKSNWRDNSITEPLVKTLFEATFRFSKKHSTDKSVVGLQAMRLMSNNINILCWYCFLRF